MSEQAKQAQLPHKTPASSVTITPLKHQSSLERCAGFFGPARQIPLAWVSAVLTLLLLILTTTYASQATFGSSVRLVYSSSSRPIFVLRVLSEVTGVLLTCTIAAAFERIQWLLVARRDGLRFTDFICLQAGTTALGILTLTAGRGVRTVTTRLWSTIRLISIILVPVLGVLIMSDVQTKPAYHSVKTLDSSFGFGMRPFNASIAQQLAPVTDLLFAKLGNLLTDSTRAVDLTPTVGPAKSCVQGIATRRGQTCERVVFVPGGIDLMAVQLESDDDLPEADVYLTQNQQGYVFKFEGVGSEWRSDSTSTCRVYGGQAGFRLCLKNSAEDLIYANIVQCPVKTAINQQCASNTTWHSSPGWSTILKTSFRNASISFSRSNGTILSHTFPASNETPAPINATDLFRAYDSFFGATGNDPTLELLTSLTGASAGPLFVKYVWSILNLHARIAISNPAIATRNVNALHNLLTVPLYLCQVSTTAFDSIKAYFDDDDNGNGNGPLPVIINPERSTVVSLATLRYELVVARGTFIAYVVLTGLALALCFVALAVGSVGEAARRIPRTTAFPVRDFCVECDVRDGEGRVLERRDFDGLARVKGTEMVRRMEEVKVVRRGEELERTGLVGSSV